MRQQDLGDVTRPCATITALLNKRQDDLRCFPREINAELRSRLLDGRGSYARRSHRYWRLAIGCRLDHFLAEQMTQRCKVFILIGDDPFRRVDASLEIAQECRLGHEAILAMLSRLQRTTAGRLPLWRERD
jgi:hypothetical protein